MSKLDLAVLGPRDPDLELEDQGSIRLLTQGASQSTQGDARRVVAPMAQLVSKPGHGGITGHVPDPPTGRREGGCCRGAAALDLARKQHQRVQSDHTILRGGRLHPGIEPGRGVGDDLGRRIPPAPTRMRHVTPALVPVDGITERLEEGLARCDGQLTSGRRRRCVGEARDHPTQVRLERVRLEQLDPRPHGLPGVHHLLQPVNLTPVGNAAHGGVRVESWAVPAVARLVEATVHALQEQEDAAVGSNRRIRPRATGVEDAELVPLEGPRQVARHIVNLESVRRPASPKPAHDARGLGRVLVADEHDVRGARDDVLEPDRGDEARVGALHAKELREEHEECPTRYGPGRHEPTYLSTLLHGPCFLLVIPAYVPVRGRGVPPSMGASPSGARSTGRGT